MLVFPSEEQNFKETRKRRKGELTDGGGGYEAEKDE
jgi:hypothetical protein